MWASSTPTKDLHEKYKPLNSNIQAISLSILSRSPRSMGVLDAQKYNSIIFNHKTL